MANKYPDALYDVGYQLAALNYVEMKLLARKLTGALDTEGLDADLVAETLSELATEMQKQEHA